jgi:hypothetical protein
MRVAEQVKTADEQVKTDELPQSRRCGMARARLTLECAHTVAASKTWRTRAPAPRGPHIPQMTAWTLNHIRHGL